MLARVVGAAPGRIVAVVRRDDGEVAFAQDRRDLRHPAVESLERRGMARMSRRWPNSVSKSTRFAKTKPPSGSVRRASIAAVRQARSRAA